MAAASTMKKTWIPAIGLIVVVILFASVFTVSEREHAVVLEFGKPVRSIKDPGLYFKLPVIQEVRRLPSTKQFWANRPNELLVDLPTKDGKKIEISVWAIWRITDAEQFVKVLRNVDNAEKQVVQRVRAAVRDVVTSYDLSEVVRSTDRELTYSFGLDDLDAGSTDAAETQLSDVGEQATIRVGREKIMNEIRDMVIAQVTKTTTSEDGKDIDRGIELIDIGVSNISFVESVRIAAFERLKAFMESIAAKYYNEGEERKQRILNQTTAEEMKILGEGEEQSKRLRGEVEAEMIEAYATAIKATGDFYNFQRTLEVFENSLSGDTRLILTTDSDLFRMLKSVDGAATPATQSP